MTDKTKFLVQPQDAEIMALNPIIRTKILTSVAIYLVHVWMGHVNAIKPGIQGQ